MRLFIGFHLGNLYIMDSFFVHAGIISLLYLTIKFAEMRLVNKEMKPIKEIAREVLIVFMSVLLGMYGISEFMPTAASLKKGATKAFTDAPGF